MYKFLVATLLLASVIGPMSCAGDKDNKSPVPDPHDSHPDDKSVVAPDPEPPSPKTTTPKPSPPTPPTTPPSSSTPAPPPSSSTTPSTTPPTPPPTTPSTTQPTSHAPSTNGTTPSPTHPTSTPAPPPPDRKFEAFSFIGGFALAIGLVAIGFLAWKLYISRRENVYHTL